MTALLLTADRTASPSASIALLAGGVAGALIRILLQRVLGDRTTIMRTWMAESVIAFILGSAVGAPLTIADDTTGWLGLAGSGLSTYAAASAALAFLDRPVPPAPAFARAAARLAGATLATTAGIIAVILAARLISA